MNRQLVWYCWPIVGRFGWLKSAGSRTKRVLEIARGRMVLRWPQMPTKRSYVSFVIQNTVKHSELRLPVGIVSVPTAGEATWSMHYNTGGSRWWGTLALWRTVPRCVIEACTAWLMERASYFGQALPLPSQAAFETSLHSPHSPTSNPTRLRPRLFHPKSEQPCWQTQRRSRSCMSACCHRGSPVLMLNASNGWLPSTNS